MAAYEQIHGEIDPAELHANCAAQIQSLSHQRQELQTENIQLKSQVFILFFLCANSIDQQSKSPFDIDHQHENRDHEYSKSEPFLGGQI